jgi:hypothetical protein
VQLLIQFANISSFLVGEGISYVGVNLSIMLLYDFLTTTFNLYFIFHFKISCLAFGYGNFYITGFTAYQSTHDLIY